MKKCNNCGTKSCANNGKIGVPIGCNDYTPPMPQTNADRLVSKTPEELADWLCQTQFREGDFCPPKHGWQYCIMADGCRVCWLDWLKSPAEEGK